MQEKKLHKLGKTDLLTLIYKQEKQIQQLTKEVEELKKQLEDRTINLKEAGSIAEASLRINKIFEVAQQAADEYLKSIKEVNKPSHECAEIKEETSEDKTYSEIEKNFYGENTYEKNTNDKNNKELILINNKIGKPKVKFTKKVLILFVSLVGITAKGIAIIWKALKTIFQKSKLSVKIKVIKFKCKISAIKKRINIIYDKVKNHMIGFCEYCKIHSVLALKDIINTIVLCLKILRLVFNKIISFAKKHKQKLFKFFRLRLANLKLEIRNKKADKIKLLNGEKEKEFKQSEYPLIVINNSLIRKSKIQVAIKRYFQKLYILVKKVTYKIILNFKKVIFYSITKIKNTITKSKLLISKVSKNLNILAKKSIRKLILYAKKLKKVIMTNSIKLIVLIKYRMIESKKKIKKRKKTIKKDNKTPIKNLQISMPELEKELKRRKQKKLKITFIRTLAYSAMVIIAFAIITSTSLFKILQVSGTSMLPTLTEGELLITSKFFKYEKGDMVAFYYNDNVLIKRVIATENDIVNIEYDGTVYVNSTKIEEKYVKQLTLGNCDITFPYQVPKNSVFILGDNREESIDSRSKSLGSITEDKIIGKIQFKLNPFVIY